MRKIEPKNLPLHVFTQFLRSTPATLRVKFWKIDGAGRSRQDERRLTMFGYCSDAQNFNSLASAKLFIMWWPGTGLNRRRRPFQGRLATELSGLESADMVDAISVTACRSRMVWDSLGCFRPYDGRVLAVRPPQKIDSDYFTAGVVRRRL